MAQKVSVTYACDFDQKEIPEGQRHVRRFSVDGRDYEIDLCERHNERFDEAIGKFVEHARRAGARQRPARAKRRTAAHRQHSANVRAWAKSTGLPVSDRGRIPADVVARYEATHR